eukprot:5186477-Prymnesium_polylepis.1
MLLTDSQLLFGLDGGVHLSTVRAEGIDPVESDDDDGGGEDDDGGAGSDGSDGGDGGDDRDNDEAVLAPPPGASVVSTPPLGAGRRDATRAANPHVALLRAAGM